MKILTRSLLISITLFWLNTSTAQLSPTVNMTLRSKVAFGTGGANICGYADVTNGKEYALVGNGLGMAIVDVTNPNAPVTLQQVAGLPSLWREIKVYNHYAYVTTEAAGSGLQIVDLSTLPATAAVKVYTGGDGILTTIQRIHALHIDTDKGYCYLFGGNSIITPVGGTATNTNGVAVVLDINDPWNPKYVGKSATVFNNNNDYIHDGYVRNNILYAGHVYAGYFSIIDFTNKANPIIINKQQTPTAFNHNTWLSDDSRTLFTTDENAGSYVGAYDVSDPLNIRFLDKIRSVSGANPIVHNVHIINDYAVTSWYTEGVIIIDAHRPQNLVQVAQYDTYAPANFGFNGCWGVYPFLPSGNLICSNLADTMYVVTPQYVRACYLEGTVRDATTGSVLSGVLVKINSTDADKKAESSSQGIYRTGQVTGGTFSVTYSKTGYYTQVFPAIVLANGVVQYQDVALLPIIVPIELIGFQAIAEKDKVKLTWKTATELNVNSFDIEKLTVENNIEKWTSISSTKPTNAPNNYVTFDNQPTIGINYYRLKTGDVDGSFKLSNIVSVKFESDKTPVFIYPNPSKNRIFLSNNTYNDVQKVEILDMSGKVVLQSTIGQGRAGFDIQSLANGAYFLRVGDGLILPFSKTL
jgi:choice-of-anchor B domain-containing protein